MQRHAEPIPDNRPLTDRELRLTRWMLEHGKPEAETFVEQLNFARVTSRCPCGCASVDFTIEGFPQAKGGMRILADFLFGDENGLCGAFVFEMNGVLAGLEICGYAADAPKSLPEIEELRPLLQTPNP
jgi:hypothetical protein